MSMRGVGYPISAEDTNRANTRFFAGQARKTKNTYRVSFSIPAPVARPCRRGGSDVITKMEIETR